MSQYEMNDEDKLYDDFGNYIGPDLSDDNDSDESSSDNDSNGSDWDDFAAHGVSPRTQQKLQNNNNNNNNNNNDIKDNDDDDDDDDNDIDLVQINQTNIQTSFEQSKANTLQLISSSNSNINNNNNDNNNNNAIILHDDKQYYKSAQDVYGDNVEINIQEEDTQPLSKPIIAPIKEKCFKLIEKELPRTTFNWNFLTGLMDKPSLIRNIAFIGHLHHGKTSFIDMLIKQTHLNYNNMSNSNKPGLRKKLKHSDYYSNMLRYTDTRLDEQDRGISIKSTPISLCLPDIRDKHWLINIIDTPGHTNFTDEITAAARLVDGVVIVVDAAEGVLLNTRKSIIHAIDNGLSLCLILNKIDRLIIELRLPPKDAYFKLYFILTEINDIIKEQLPNNYKKYLLNPISDNVCFASSLFSWSFTLKSFSKIYSDYHRTFNYMDIYRKLWGNVYYDNGEFRTFKSGKLNPKFRRTFIQFILEPLYKIYSHTLGTDPVKLYQLFSELGIKLNKTELNLDPKPLLNVILTKFFSNKHTGFVTMILNNIPSPGEGNKIKVLNNYTGNLNDNVSLNMIKCNSSTPYSVVNITKMYSRANSSGNSLEFDAFGRVYCGTVRVGDQVRILREGYTLDDTEDMSIMTINSIWIYQGRYRIAINQVRAGNLALFGGIDTAITKTATITSNNLHSASVCIFKPLLFNTISICRVAIEPIKPSELPKMTSGLRCINKSYPLCTTAIEESGEHIILGTGELYLDCLLHDLRKMYSLIEIKVSDPIVSFCETVEETSTIKCCGYTANKKNNFNMICEPLDSNIGDNICNNIIDINWTSKQLSKYFTNMYGWDLLTGRNIWAFGPNKNGANILINDTISNNSNNSRINDVRNSIIQGFEWGTREGPLCDEPIRNCIFKLLDINISSGNKYEYNSGQIIPTIRRLLYSSFMLAHPRLMEPILFSEVICPADCILPVENVVKHRRGRLISEEQLSGTPFIKLYIELPAIDSFGFETDLRSHTQGQAFCLQIFNKWDIVPGDPMDENIVLIPLEPQSTHKLSREFMIKTRKRKGLNTNVTYHKYFDDEMFKLFEQSCMDDDNIDNNA